MLWHGRAFTYTRRMLKFTAYSLRFILMALCVSPAMFLLLYGYAYVECTTSHLPPPAGAGCNWWKGALALTGTGMVAAAPAIVIFLALRRRLQRKNMQQAFIHALAGSMVFAAFAMVGRIRYADDYMIPLATIGGFIAALVYHVISTRLNRTTRYF